MSLYDLSSLFSTTDVCTNPSKRRGPGSFYHRIMLGMSILDCSASFFGSFLGSCVMPKGSHYYAVGTLATCDAASFFHQLGLLGTPMYNCSLMTLLLLSIAYNWGPMRLKKVEKWFHIVPWTLCLTCAVVAFPLKVYGPSFMSCWTVPSYPKECMGTEEGCIRISGFGGNAYAYYWLLGLAVIIGCICFVGTTAVILYRKVLKIEIDAERHDFLARFRESQSSQNRHQSRRIMKQGLLYSGALLLTWIMPLIVIIFALTGPGTIYATDLLLTIFYPMQGFMNVLIYLMPKGSSNTSYSSTRRASLIEIPQACLSVNREKK